MEPRVSDGIVVTVFIVGWIALSVAIGRIAWTFGRSPAVWLILAVIFSPLVAFVFLLIAGEASGDGRARGERHRRRARRRPEPQPGSG
jgi:hypothetical protein